MRVEPRYYTDDDGKKCLRGLCLIMEFEEESIMVDALSKDTYSDDDGLIDTLAAEMRLSDGYGEHYIYLKAAHLGKVTVEEE